MPFEIYLQREAARWRAFVLAWSAQPGIIQVRYEDFLRDPKAQLTRLLHQLGYLVGPEVVEQAVQRNTKDRWRQALAKVFTYNTFVRKGVAGDWRQHLTEEQKRRFLQIAGDVLHALGYEAA